MGIFKFQLKFHKILIAISPKFVPKSLIDNKLAFQIITWHWTGDKPLSEPMLHNLLMQKCITQPQWVTLLLHFVLFKIWRVNVLLTGLDSILENLVALYWIHASLP